MSDFTDYLAHGWKLCALRPGTKKPMGREWNRKANALNEVQAAQVRGAGLMHSYSGTMALDVDDYPRAADWLAERGIDLDELFADPMSVQIVSGRQGSGKLLYACTEPAASYKVMDGRDTILEFRCATANGLAVQDVLPPSIHPETGAPYKWRYGNPVLGDWRDPPDLPEPLREVWLAQLPRQVPENPAPAPLEVPEPSAELEELRELLKNHDPNAGRDVWIRVGAALHHETQGSLEGLNLWDEWSQASDKYVDYEDLAKDWRSFRLDRENAVTAGFLRQTATASIDEFADLTKVPQDDTDDPWAALAAERSAKFAPVHVSEVAKRPPPEWIIDGLLPQTDLVMLYGQPGAGKSYIALDMAFAIATGEKWAKLDTTPGPVVWIAAEAAGSLQIRTMAYARQHGMALENADLWIIDSALSLMDEEDASALSTAMADLRPRLIIVDTLAAASGGANENSGEDMNKVLTSCRNLHRESGATVMLVHHSGKDESRGARGWSGIKGAMQTELLAVNNEGRRVLTVTKQRDGTEGDTWPVNLIPVPLDDTHEACIVKLGAKITRTTEKNPLPGLRGVQLVVYRTINDLALVEGGAVRVQDVYEGAVKTLPPPPAGEKDRRKTAVKRALEGMIQKNYLEVAEDLLFLTKPEDGDE